MNDLVAKSIVEKVKAAWSGVPYPGDNNIFTRDSFDDEGITEYFRGTTWEGHSAKSLRVHSTAISTFFTPIAYHYWLPAYLIAAIDSPEELDVGFDSLVSSLSPAKDGPFLRAGQQEKFDLLTIKQKLAVIATLEYLIDRRDTDKAPMYDEKAVLQYFYSITDRA